jgi:hypothetical protein
MAANVHGRQVPSIAQFILAFRETDARTQVLQIGPTRVSSARERMPNVRQGCAKCTYIMIKVCEAGAGWRAGTAYRRIRGGKSASMTLEVPLKTKTPAKVAASADTSSPLITLSD